MLFHLTNSERAEKLVVFSNNPLCTGFYKMDLTKFLQENFRKDFFLRATVISKPDEEVSLLFAYQTEGYLRLFLTQFSLNIKLSFKIKGVVDSFNNTEYLVSTNIYSQSPQIDLKNLQKEKMMILSNSFELSEYPIRSLFFNQKLLEGQNLIYFKIKIRPDILPFLTTTKTSAGVEGPVELFQMKLRQEPETVNQYYQGVVNLIIGEE